MSTDVLEAEPKPAQAGSYYGELSSGGEWRWTGTGLPDDDWQQVAETPAAPAAPPSPIAGQEMTMTNPRGEVTPSASETLAEFMARCPNQWQGDDGFLAWLTDLYNYGVASVSQPSAPAISYVDPNSVPSRVNATVNVVGTGFDPTTAKVFLDNTIQLTPTGTPTATLLTVDIPAATLTPNIKYFMVTVINGDGEVSNAVNLYVV